MATPNKESETLHSFLGMEEVDYGSDTSVQGDKRTMSESPVPEDKPLSAPNPFFECSDANAPSAQHVASVADATNITNPLDEYQERLLQQEESARRRAHIAHKLRSHRDYEFTPLSVEERLRQAGGQSLVHWTIGPEASSPEEIANRQALRERYLAPCVTTQSQYLVRLQTQARGAPVPPMKGIPILLFSGDTIDEEDGDFVRWVHRVRRLSSIYSLRASADVADVRLERKLRYDYAKLKARGQLRMRKRYASATHVATDPSQTDLQDPSSHTTTGAKRTRSHYDPGRDAQKHQRRTGSLAEGEFQTPMSSRSQGNPATLPDTGIDLCDDVAGEVSPRGTGGSLARREESVVAGVPVETHEKLVLQVKTLEEALGKTHVAMDAMQARIQALERGLTWSEAQVDLLIRLQLSGAPPSSSAPAPPSSHGTDPDTA